MADTVNGTGDGDVINGTDGADNIYGKGGDDVISGGAGNDNLRGGEGSDRLFGGEGNDFLDGGEGADYMDGGEGNDTYVVDDKQDVIVEHADGGYDSVKSWIDYTLRPNLERLDLLGDLDLNGTGNDLANSLNGNIGANSLRGLAGNDSLNGYGGNDFLDGGDGNDYMDGGDGIDTAVYRFSTAGVSVNLGLAKQNTIGSGIDTLKNIENIDGSEFNDTLTGNSDANKIIGNGGADRITGGGGNDDLTGGAGADVFVFSAAAANGVDKIRGFESGTDLLEFHTADGYSSIAAFTVNNTGEATTGSAEFIYANSKLYYDADGIGGSDATLLADFSNNPNVNLQATDFLFS